MICKVRKERRLVHTENFVDLAVVQDDVIVCGLRVSLRSLMPLKFLRDRCSMNQ
jgi:hypothetical protein